MDLLQNLNSLQIKQVSLQATGTNWTTTSAAGVPYKTVNGAWRLRFNIRGALSVAASTLTLTIAGVTFDRSQAITATLWNGVNFYPADRAEVTTATGNIELEAASTFDEIMVSGDVELPGKPDFA